MAHGWICDNCGAGLPVNSRGDDGNGESAAWLTVGTKDGGLSEDACSRSCAIELLGDGSPFADDVDERLAAVVDIARAIRQED